MPDVEIVMIGLGDIHLQMLELTRPRVEKLIGPVTSITAGSPFDVKLELLETATKPILFIDSDIVLFDWDWSFFHFENFNAVPDALSPSWPGTAQILNKMPFPHRKTINSGLWLAPPSLKPIFSYAKLLTTTLFNDFPYALGDQTSLNYALQDSGVNIQWLPSRFNHQISPSHYDPAPPSGVIGVHLVGGTIPNPVNPVNLDTKLKRVQDYCKKYPL